MYRTPVDGLHLLILHKLMKQKRVTKFRW